MSIAEEEKRIDEILKASRERMRTVDERVDMLTREQSSIAQDIQILSHRLETVQDRLRVKKEVLKKVTASSAEAEETYRKLKESTKLLLVGLKKEVRMIDEQLGEPLEGG